MTASCQDARLAPGSMPWEPVGRGGRAHLPVSPAHRFPRPGGVMSSWISPIVGIVYLVVGLVVASSHAFLANLNTLMPIVSAVLAVVLWPLVLVGVDLHLH